MMRVDVVKEIAGRLVQVVLAVAHVVDALNASVAPQHLDIVGELHCPRVATGSDLRDSLSALSLHTAKAPQTKKKKKKKRFLSDC
jgi:hypothetical protein